MDINEIAEGFAEVNVTWNSENGDLTDPVSVDSTDGDIKAWVEESIRGGDIDGISADTNVDLTDFVVDRFPSRFFIRPKATFGSF